MIQPEQSPISFVVDVRRLPQKGFPVTIDPNEAELAALAGAHGLLGVSSFHAELVVRDWKRDGISAKGSVKAKIVQECIVTLEPVEAEIDEEIEALFVPEGSPLARPQGGDGEMFVDADGPDGPEIFDGQRIDAGALAEEFFALAIDPYPRKSGAQLPESLSDGPTGSPLGKLAERLQKR